MVVDWGGDKKSNQEKLGATQTLVHLFGFLQHESANTLLLAAGCLASLQREQCSTLVCARRCNADCASASWQSALQYHARTQGHVLTASETAPYAKVVALADLGEFLAVATSGLMSVNEHSSSRDSLFVLLEGGEQIGEVVQFDWLHVAWPY